MDGKMTEFRSMLVDLLVEFSSLCRDTGVRWWLWGGTLLGAVRHQGFIPWDFDLDVCVRPGAIKTLVSSSERFSESVDPSFYGLFRPGTTMVNVLDNRWTRRLSEGKLPCGIHIDVFPVFNVPDDADEGAKFFDSTLNRSFAEHDRYRDKTSTVSSMLMRDYHVPSSCFAPGFTAVFEGVECPIPRRPDIVLSRMYGDDYMVPKQCNDPGVRHYVDVRHDWTEYSSGARRIPDWKPCAESPSLMFA